MADFNCLGTANKPIKFGKWLTDASQVKENDDQCVEGLQKMSLFLQFTGLIMTYDKLFVNRLGRFDRLNGVYIEYNLAPVQPSFCKSNLTHRQSELLNYKVGEMLQSGHLRPSWSQWSSRVLPIFINGSLEMSVEYFDIHRHLTSLFYCDTPEMKQVLDSVTQADLFSRITVKDAFHQISLGRRSAQVMAFATDSGSLEFTTLHHGMKDAQTILQYVMQSILRDVDKRFVKIYLGQILVHSVDHDSHMTVLMQILDSFQAWNVKIDFEQSYFLMKSVIFLGSLINRNGRRTDPSRLQKLKRPMNIRDVRSFLGLVGNHQENITNFHQQTEPLRKLVGVFDRFRQPFRWGAEEENAFVALKSQLITAAPIPLKPFSTQAVQSFRPTMSRETGE